MKKKHIHYHKDGTMWGKGFLNNGEMDGAWVWFRKDGSKMRSGNFKLGIQVGEWVTYDKQGKIVKKTTMKTKICSRGHKYTGSGPCPTCWRGNKKSKK